MLPRIFVFLTICGLMGSTLRAQNAPATPPPPQDASAPAQGIRLRIGGNVMAAKIVHLVQPEYPDIARKQPPITGTVILHAVIAKDGSVQELQPVSGPPLLINSAMDAVRQWKYEPTLLKGEPVEVDTTIAVLYEFGGGASNSNSPPAASEPPAAPATTMTTSAPAPSEGKPPRIRMAGSVHPEVIHMVKPNYPKEAKKERWWATSYFTSFWEPTAQF
jgi:TonB family protein